MGRTRVIFALVALWAVAAMAAPDAGSWNGWVSDSKCRGADHSAACVKKCLAAGNAMVFVDDADKSVLPIANPDSLAGHEGHHVKVQGTVENGKLNVSKVEMLPDQKGK
ncbi:MAG TPA: hypothetical protein VFM10_08525 [Terriglobales bacterium]|jgi:hypothetical protein|nr:hypothetical protein [Terriglobales bacterium]